MAKKKLKKAIAKAKSVPKKMICEPMKLNALKFGWAGGKVTGLMVALTTIAGIYGIMGGFPLFNGLIADIYGTLGYTVSWLGVLLGAIYGFIDGFIFFGLMAWLYNMKCCWMK